MKPPAVLIAAVALIAVDGGAVAAALTLDVSPTALVANGLTTHGQAVFVGFSREIDPEDDVVSIRRRVEVLADDDGDGSVTLDLGELVPNRSMWVAVDLATGSAAAAAPPGFRLQSVGWKGHGTLRGAVHDVVEDARPFAEVFVVRQGVGAWTLRVGDGGPDDADGLSDGKFQAALDAMTPLPGSPVPPQQFLPSDLVIVMDPNALEFTVALAGETL